MIAKITVIAADKIRAHRNFAENGADFRSAHPGQSIFHPSLKFNGPMERQTSQYPNFR
jgi:hypothetical protein